MLLTLLLMCGAEMPHVFKRSKEMKTALLHGADAILSTEALRRLARSYTTPDPLITEILAERQRVPTLREACRRAIRRDLFTRAVPFSALPELEGVGPSHLLSFLAYNQPVPSPETGDAKCDECFRTIFRLLMESKKKQ
jgi:hypothetical protein